MNHPPVSTTTLRSYGGMDKLLHWAVAINLIAILFAANGLADRPEAEKVAEYGSHGLAVTFLAGLMLFRVIWRLIHPAPPLPDSVGPWSRIGARIVHWGLYGLVIFQICIGFFLASTVETAFVPALIGVDYSSFGLAPASLYGLLHILHAVTYWLIVTAVTVHLAAALKHALVDRDGVFSRMIPGAGGRSS
ncbi:cytochrome b [Phaeobacter inhibens]|uniref:cytochrome b n=1 Tax=Phaeobacter inhibens TaxID=221822 RepID=UPI0021A965F5|nr:cytochrome b/b6 domain-containing protein [Phaeobacter inhibens]UWR55534.1 cytochrome b/b6 domain-containing protein [Phaeobacter inhibens]